jgi:hypothetical protein
MQYQYNENLIGLYKNLQVIMNKTFDKVKIKITVWEKS